jgi:hypothetical protein
MSIKMVYTSYTGPRNTINSILGTLALVSLCYYGTMDNPYIIVITLIMASRLLYKIHCYLLKEVVSRTDVVGDSIMVSILTYTGVMPQFNFDATVVGLYMFQGLCVTITVCKLVLHMTYVQPS